MHDFEEPIKDDEETSLLTSGDRESQATEVESTTPEHDQRAADESEQVSFDPEKFKSQHFEQKSGNALTVAAPTYGKLTQSYAVSQISVRQSEYEVDLFFLVGKTLIIGLSSM